LGASDIAILCSDNEGVPLSLIQAALAKLPIISTDVGSVTDLVKHGVNGYVTSKNPVEIANFLENLIDDPKLRSVFGEASFEIAQGSFTSKAMMEKHKKLYQLTIK
jgi:glycosyltransferase involved in cell wall biosynthesis